MQADMRTIESQLSTAVFDKKHAVMENAQLTSMLDVSRREVLELRSISEHEIAKREATEAELQAKDEELTEVHRQLLAAHDTEAMSQEVRSVLLILKLNKTFFPDTLIQNFLL